MLKTSLSPYAQKIVDRSRNVVISHRADSQDVDHAVRSVVSDLYREVEPNRCDRTVNAALIEIVQNYVTDLVAREK